MTIDPDMREICELFFQESAEGLDAMEAGLLGLTSGAADPETMNEIFRAAHSIKGGASTFGFMDVSGFTHHVETLLDRMRKNEYPVTEDAVTLLLQTVDCIRSMVGALMEDRAPDMARAATLQRALESLPVPGIPPATTTAAPLSQSQPVAASVTGSGWNIIYRPHEDVLRSCNDPALIMRELNRLGDATVTVCGVDQLDFAALDPETCQLWWQIALRGDVSHEQIKEVFAWVEGQCELDITPLESDHAAVPESTTAIAVASMQTAPTVSIDDATSAIEGPAINRKASQDVASIRVSTDKVDVLINLVGELVITQSMLARFNESFSTDDLDTLRDGLAQLTRTTRELQEQAMRIRMLPIRGTFARFPRLVHDLSRKLGKKITLKLTGEDTELDKIVLEKIADPLVHLVRNCLDHGIESPAARRAAGKPETGTLELSAYHESGTIVIDVIDDGGGIDSRKVLAKARAAGLVPEDEVPSQDRINNLIFEPGFSTADQISDVSGRGVGLDVVRRNIGDLGGHVHIQSTEGRGSTFRIRLPLTLAILDGQLARVGSEIYIIPLISILETRQVQREHISLIAGQAELYRVRDEYLPIVRLSEHFHVPPNGSAVSDGLLVIAEADGRRAGLLVDDLLGQQQVVIKSLQTNYYTVPGFSGATILGDGTVSLILDVPGVIRAARQSPAIPVQTANAASARASVVNSTTSTRLH